MAAVSTAEAAGRQYAERPDRVYTDVMRDFIIALLAVDMLAVVVVMLIGAIGMVDANRDPRTSNKLMRLRVILQGVAIALVVVLMATSM
jgi:hypothetical protein